jgi:phenylalanyl-tRNA synthetase alpha chain
MSPEERRTAGPALNALRDELAAALAARKAALADAALEERLKTEWLDVTLPPRPRGTAAGAHPPGRAQVMEELTAIFADMGFAVAEGPEVEGDWYNFDALNIPPDHPARADDGHLLHGARRGRQRAAARVAHPHQPRADPHMETRRRPAASSRPAGSTAPTTTRPTRRCSTRSRGSPSTATSRWRTSSGCSRTSARLLRGRRRAGCVPRLALPLHRALGRGRHPLLLGGRAAQDRRGRRLAGDPGQRDGPPEGAGAAGIDPERWQGFAFGMGIDRIAMLKYGIPDLRAFFESDLRWLRHYGFAALDLPTLPRGLSDRLPSAFEARGKRRITSATAAAASTGPNPARLSQPRPA